MPAVVVLGMHRSGTSLVANVLRQLGVQMGEVLLGPNRWNPHGYWEDVDFLRLNVSILRAANGSWASPPAREAIAEAGEWFGREIGRVVEARAWQGLWGWKDPRTVLTVGLYQGHLREPRYVHVRRKRRAVVASLLRRHAEDNFWLARRRGKDWARLVEEYEKRIREFRGGVGDGEWCAVRLEELMNPARAPAVVRELAEFVGGDGQRVDEALGVIAFPE